MVDYGPGVTTVKTDLYPAWLATQLEHLPRVLKPRAAFVFNIRDKVEHGFISDYVDNSKQVIKDLGFRLWDVWFWFKSSCPPGNLATSLQRPHNQMEYLFIFAQETPYFNADAIRRRYAESTLERYKYIHHKSTHHHKEGFLRAHPGGALPSNLWVYRPTELPEHPAVMSEPMAEVLILGLSSPGDIVLDMFGGSGTTFRAAKKQNRRRIGCDIKQEYVDLAWRRLGEIVQVGFGI